MRGYGGIWEVNEGVWEVNRGITVTDYSHGLQSRITVTDYSHGLHRVDKGNTGWRMGGK